MTHLHKLPIYVSGKHTQKIKRHNIFLLKHDPFLEEEKP